MRSWLWLIGLDRIRLGRVVLASLALCWLASCASDEAKFASHIERGEGYVETEKWPEAIIEFRNALQLDPNSGDAHYQLSQVHLKAGQAREAFWELRETVRLDDANLEAKIQFAQLSIFAGELEEALERSDEVIEADPGRMEAYVVKAQALEGLKQLEEARVAYQAAVDADPESLSALLLFAEFLRRNGERDEAEPLFRKGLEIEASYPAYAALGAFLRGNPDSEVEVEEVLREAIAVAEGDAQIIRAYSVLAASLFQIERFPESYQLLEQGIERAENPLDLIYLLARMYRNQGDGEKADELIERATKERPDDVVPFLVLSSLRGRKGDLKGALQAAQSALDITGENPAASLRRAEVLLEMGVRDDDPAAIAEARTIVDAELEKAPSLAEGLFVRAKLEVQARQIEEAIRTLRSTIDLRADWAEAHFMLGTALMLAGERTAARTELARSLEIDPTQVEARHALARVHAALGEHEYAVEEGQRYLQARPDNISTRILVGQSLLAMDQPLAALEVIMEVPETDRDAQVEYALGRIYGRLDRAADSRAALEKALAEVPSQPEILTALLELDVGEGRVAESDARVAAAVAESPDNARLHQLAGTLALAKNDVAGAEEAFKRAIEADEDAIGAYRQLANLYVRTGRTQETIRTYEEAVAVQNDQPQLHHVLGVLYEAAGDPDKAIPHYEAAIRYSPEQGESKNNLAYILAEKGENLDEALDLAQEAKQLLPDDPNTADTLGWVLFRRGVPSAAIGYLREAEAGMTARYREDPLGDPSGLGLIRHHLALAYQGSGDVENAKVMLGRALETYDEWVADRSAQGRRAAPTPTWYTEIKTLRETL